MRLGAPVFRKTLDPIAWAHAHRDAGYSATYAPSELVETCDEQLAREFVSAAKQYDIVIAEIGSWSNTISADEAVARKAIAQCTERLAFADLLGASCCVNIAGSRGERWDGPHPDNLSPATFELIVEVVRKIVDAVKPTRTVYSLETMPWVFPDSPESYLRLVSAIDRRAFAVHLDPVNMINCPARAYHTGDFLRESFRLLGPYIVSVHAKDIRFSQHLTLHLDECGPGEGLLDYPTFLREMDRLGPDVPMMIEHLKTPEQYAAAAQFIRDTAGKIGVNIK
ncbi:MAG TPA: sugar phosphate isomerase/epimerase family protein [Tepidisphaeraceae bacterium]|nr:sugar phosphate isomerase/epimerase family protein [Tepidisphaeraceae bacterium]